MKDRDLQDEGETGPPRSGRGLIGRLAGLARLLVAVVSGLRQLPRLVLAWMRQHVAHVAALG